MGVEENSSKKNLLELMKKNKLFNVLIKKDPSSK